MSPISIADIKGNVCFIKNSIECFTSFKFDILKTLSVIAGDSPDEAYRQEMYVE